MSTCKSPCCLQLSVSSLYQHCYRSPQERSNLSNPQDARYSLQSKIASERRYSPRLRRARLIFTVDSPCGNQVCGEKIASEWRCAILVHSDWFSADQAILWQPLIVGPEPWVWLAQVLRGASKKLRPPASLNVFPCSIARRAFPRNVDCFFFSLSSFSLLLSGKPAL